MFLRRLGTSTSAALRRGANEGDLLAALRAEIAHELSSSFPPSQEILNFATVTDAPGAQDVLLRRRGAAGEEVLVSALLAPLRFQGEDPLPRDALMKVFVSKAGAKPVLRFDCRASADGSGGGGAADYDITSVCYHSFPGDAGDGKYEGPRFSLWILLTAGSLSLGPKNINEETLLPQYHLSTWSWFAHKGYLSELGYWPLNSYFSL